MISRKCSVAEDRQKHCNNSHPLMRLLPSSSARKLLSRQRLHFVRKVSSFQEGVVKVVKAANVGRGIREILQMPW
jgi:hypothetical protein